MNKITLLITAVGGRRYLLVLLSGAAATVLQYAGKLDPAGTTYALVIVGTVGAYIIGNTAQKIRSAPAAEPPH